MLYMAKTILPILRALANPDCLGLIGYFIYETPVTI
jgi:hypothetical protein